MTVTVVPLPGVPEVRPGDDLAALLLDALRAAGLALADGDVLAVTSKVVAKAEGRLVPLPPDEAGRAAAHDAAVAAETVRVVARRGRMVIAETRQGFVGANALVDTSNAGGDVLVLPPLDADASAARLRARLAAATGRDVAVVVTDTLGRPWRVGQTDVAVGLAGMGAVADHRGQPDADGRILEVTEVAVADEVAAAADLVKGKTLGVPAALLRGVGRPDGDGRARDLVRPPADDLFRTGAGPDGLLEFVESSRTRRRFTHDPVERGAVERALLAAAGTPRPDGTSPLRWVELASAEARGAYLDALEAAWRADLSAGGASEAAVAGRSARRRALLGEAPVLLVPCGTGLPDERGGAPFLLAAGAAVQTLVLALHAHGLGTAWVPATASHALAAAEAIGLMAGWQPLGSVAVGHPDAGDPRLGRRPAQLGELLTRR